MERDNRSKTNSSPRRFFSASPKGRAPDGEAEADALVRRDNPEGHEARIRSLDTIDVEALTPGQILASFRRLRLGSIIWLMSVMIAAASAVSSAAYHFGGTAALQAHVAADSQTVARLRGSGMTSVSDRLSNQELKEFLAQAQFRVRIIVPWFVDPLTIKEALGGLLENDQASVQIFFLDPSSPHLKERGRIARPDLDNYGPNETLRSLSVLGPAFRSVRTKLFTYNSIPPAFVVEADNRALLGFHLHTGVALSNPILFFDVLKDNAPTTLGRMIDNEFTALERISCEVEPRSISSDSTGRTVFRFKHTASCRQPTQSG